MIGAAAFVRHRRSHSAVPYARNVLALVFRSAKMRGNLFSQDTRAGVMFHCHALPA
jgi:hypothetical protein